MLTAVETDKVSGFQVIRYDALVYCNLKAHAPYLARITDTGEFDWQQKVFLGYGKRRETFYVVENLEPGDLVQCAGGSGGNTYPFKGRVISLTETTFTVDEIDPKTWSNLIARRKKNERRVTARDLSNGDESLDADPTHGLDGGTGGG